MIVMKFGGSSVESAKAIQRVSSIVRDRRESQPVVVVSAMGKTTDRLLAIANFCSTGDRQAAERELDKLRQFHRNEAAQLTRGFRGGRLRKLAVREPLSMNRVRSRRFRPLAI